MLRTFQLLNRRQSHLIDNLPDPLEGKYNGSGNLSHLCHNIIPSQEGDLQMIAE
jgi:hypothetical protein